MKRRWDAFRSVRQRGPAMRQMHAAPPWRARVAPLMLRCAVWEGEVVVMSDEARHVPVLAEEVLQYLAPRPGAVIVDGTVGLGGHSARLLPLVRPSGRLIAIDQDPEALRLAAERLGDDPAVVLRHANFRELPLVLRELRVPAVDGVVIDLGVSSLQLDTPERGFSFQREAPLDMRMNPHGSVTARQLVNGCSERELADCFWQLGEERFARRIARALVETRRKQPIETTTQLAVLVARTVPARRESRLHPATRVFQALRLAVNDELAALSDLLRDAPAYLKPGGRLAVIAFHSLEDRLVKQAFRAGALAGAWTVLTKKPVRPSEDETLANPRARSARLRVAQRTDAA